MSEYEVEELFTVPRSRHVLAPGAVRVPDWLDTGCQQQLAGHGLPGVGASCSMKHQVMPGAGGCPAQSVMLGTREPYRYGAAAGPRLPICRSGSWRSAPARWRRPTAGRGRRRRRAGGRVRPGPVAFDGIERVVASTARTPRWSTSTSSTARMGMHQDKDEFSAAPIVSLARGTRACSASATPRPAQRRPGRGAAVRGPLRVRRTVSLRVPRRARVLPGTGGRRLGLKTAGG
ncbi:alpha-ketoglutarate-dependent dioxygenase AlkB [Kocuria rhizophila]|nr:alpha-ketoglutarate-dependent dioxygenase AlkB [Kocuria rhizophila]